MGEYVVNERLTEASERIDALERALLAAQDNVARKESEARKPYADKIMALEAELADTRETLRHTEAQLATARAERDSFQDLSRRGRHHPH